MRNLEIRMKSVAAVVVLAALSGGCQLIVDFNRGLIDSGTVDGSFNDTGAPAVDAGMDVLPVPDAVGDVHYVESSTSADTGAHDATLDVAADATGDARADASGDAHTGTDAKADAEHDALSDTSKADAPVDAGTKSDAVSDAADAG